MTVTEAKNYLEQLEQAGHGNLQILHYDMESGEHCSVRLQEDNNTILGRFIEVLDDVDFANFVFNEI